jgi:stearoyl-CoA desaturase (Delta-9 desaturase)
LRNEALIDRRNWEGTVITAALIVFTMLQISLICNRVYLHCFLAHRAILSLHPAVATSMHLWLSVLTGIDPRKWAWKHRDHHNYKKTDPYNPFGKGQWRVFLMTWFYYAKGKPGPTDALDYSPDWVDRMPLIRYRGISGLLISAGIGAFLSHSPSGLGFGAAVWLSHLFLFSLLFSALNAFAHESGKQEGTDSKATNVWWLFPFTWGENFHKNHHDRPRLARFAQFDPAWPIIRVFQIFHMADVNDSPCPYRN